MIVAGLLYPVISEFFFKVKISPFSPHRNKLLTTDFPFMLKY